MMPHGSTARQPGYLLFISRLPLSGVFSSVFGLTANLFFIPAFYFEHHKQQQPHIHFEKTGCCSYNTEALAFPFIYIRILFD